MNKNFGYIGATSIAVKDRMAQHRTLSENGDTSTFHKRMKGHNVDYITVRSGLQYHDAVRLENEMIKTNGSLNDNTVSTGLVKVSGNRYSVYHVTKIYK